MSDPAYDSSEDSVQRSATPSSQYSIDVGDEDVMFRLTRRPRKPRKRRQKTVQQIQSVKSNTSAVISNAVSNAEKLKRIREEIREEHKIDFEALGIDDTVGYGKINARIETRERLLAQLHILRDGLEGIIKVPHYPDDTPIEKLVYIRDSFKRIVKVRKYVKSSRTKLLFVIGFIEAIARRFHVPLNKFAKIQALGMKKYDKYLIRLAEENMIEGYGDDLSTYGMIKEVAMDMMTSFGVNILGKYLDRDKSEHMIELLLGSMAECEEDDLLMRVEKGEDFFSDIDPENKKVFSDLIVEIADVMPQLCERIPKLKSMGPMIKMGMNFFRGKPAPKDDAPRKRQKPGL